MIGHLSCSGRERTLNPSHRPCQVDGSWPLPWTPIPRCSCSVCTVQYTCLLVSTRVNLNMACVTMGEGGQRRAKGEPSRPLHPNFTLPSPPQASSRSRQEVVQFHSLYVVDARKLARGGTSLSDRKWTKACAGRPRAFLAGERKRGGAGLTIELPVVGRGPPPAEYLG